MEYIEIGLVCQWKNGRISAGFGARMSFYLRVFRPVADALSQEAFSGEVLSGK